MKHLFICLLFLFPLISKADFSSRDYQCTWYIGSGWPNTDLNILEVSYLTILKKSPRKEIVFKFFAEYEQEFFKLSYSGNTQSAMRFIILPGAYNSITNEIKLISMVIPKTFYGDDAAKALNGRIEFFSKEGSEFLKGNGNCTLIKQQ